MPQQSHLLKTSVRGAYDLQKLRISTGNRITANFKAKLGQEPSESEETLAAEAKKVLVEIRASYNRLTDGAIKRPRQASFVGDDIISSYTELCLVRQYLGLLKSEEEHFSDLGLILRDFPIYTRWLHDVKGVGPAMAGVIISEFDIHKARYPSSLWRYAGLDTVTYYQREFLMYNKETGDVYDIPDRIEFRHPERHGQAFYFTESEDKGQLWLRSNVDAARLGTYRKIETGEGRSRRKAHLMQRTYTSREGKEETCASITFNPFLKTKLCGVLGPSFLRSASPYRAHYDSCRERLSQREDWKDEIKGHHHSAAIRFMLKRFLQDLYNEWRAIEGLPIAPTYEERKLRQQAQGTQIL